MAQIKLNTTIPCCPYCEHHSWSNSWGKGNAMCCSCGLEFMVDCRDGKLIIQPVEPKTRDELLYGKPHNWAKKTVVVAKPKRKDLIIDPIDPQDDGYLWSAPVYTMMEAAERVGRRVAEEVERLTLGVETEMRYGGDNIAGIDPGSPEGSTTKILTGTWNEDETRWTLDDEVTLDTLPQSIKDKLDSGAKMTDEEAALFLKADAATRAIPYPYETDIHSPHFGLYDDDDVQPDVVISDG